MLAIGCHVSLFKILIGYPKHDFTCLYEKFFSMNKMIECMIDTI